MSFKETYEMQHSHPTDRRKDTVELIKIVGYLWYDRSIELVLFRNQIVDSNVSQILHLHEYAEDFVGKSISIFDTVEVAKAIQTLDICPARIDIGKDRKSTRLNSSHVAISYAVFCLKKKTRHTEPVSRVQTY